MFKKIALVLFAALIVATPCLAITNDGGPDTYITSNTVSYSTAEFIVTFNTTVNSILVSNEDASNSLFVYFRNLGWNSDRSAYTMPYCTSSTVSSDNTVRLLPGTSISVNVKTDKIGFDSVGTGTLTYVATSDKSQP